MGGSVSGPGSMLTVDAIEGPKVVLMNTGKITTVNCSDIFVDRSDSGGCNPGFSGASVDNVIFTDGVFSGSTSRGEETCNSSSRLVTSVVLASLILVVNIVSFMMG